jgi:MFS family permease
MPELVAGLTRVCATIRRDFGSLPRQFWLLVGVIVVYLIGVEMCYPFQTLYLNGYRHISMTTVGLILGLSLLAGLPTQFFGGAFADRVGRRPVLALAAIGSMTLYGFLAFCQTVWQISLPVFFEAAFGWAMFLTASNAIVADLTPLALRAEAFSIIRVALSAGTIAGPLIAGPLLKHDPSFRLTFVTAAAVVAVFFVSVLIFIRESRPGGSGGWRRSVDDGIVAAEGTTPLPAPLDVAPNPPPPEGSGYLVVLGDRRFLLFCLVSLLPFYCFGQIWVTFPVVLHQLYSTSPTDWSHLLAVYAGCGLVLQYPLVRAVRRCDNMTLMAIASALLGISLGAGVFAPWRWATYAAVIALSVGVVLLVPISSTVVSELAPAHLRGRYMGVWTFVYLGGYALGPLFGGLAMDRLGDRVAFGLVFGLGLTGGALFWLMSGSRRTGAGEPPTEAAA